MTKIKIVERINNEGKCLELHSYTHNYKKIYSKEDIFIKKMFDFVVLMFMKIKKKLCLK